MQLVKKRTMSLKVLICSQFNFSDGCLQGPLIFIKHLRLAKAVTHSHKNDTINVVLSKDLNCLKNL